MAALDRAEFAKQCVDNGNYCGISPHYMLAVAQLRSGISDGSNGDRIGPFRLTQAEWDANRTDTQFGYDFLPQDINDPEFQCAVFGLMGHKAFNAFEQANNRNPSALELYLQQWPAAQSGTLSADLQAALDTTAPLLEPAAAITPNAPSVLPGNVKPGQTKQPANMTPVLIGLLAANRQRAQAMQVDPGIVGKVDAVTRRLIAPDAKQQYQAIAATTGVPWFVIAVIHEREASQNFAMNLAQGDPWNQVSVHVPAGRGPFASFAAAAIDALTNCAPYAARWTDWSFGGACTLLEQYNGLGYAYRGLPSPYVWASTNQYTRGKFVADRVFDPNVVDTQLGCAAMLSRMQALDASVTF